MNNFQAMSKKLRVYIWHGSDEGEFRSYDIAQQDNQTVLDIVTEIQRNHAPELAYRFACRVGVCGSCAMTVNDIPRWTCRTHVKHVINDDTLTIAPLRNLPVLKDLVVDMAPFIDSWQKAGAVFEGRENRYQPPAEIDPESPERKAADNALQCINCAVCYSACDVVHWNRDYVGPAALNRAWTLINDVRHAGRDKTLSLAFERGGCGSCHSHGNCTRHCPVQLNPSESIAGLKRHAIFGATKTK